MVDCGLSDCMQELTFISFIAGVKTAKLKLAGRFYDRLGAATEHNLAIVAVPGPARTS